MAKFPGSLYLGLETDAEFRARLVAAGVDAIQAGWKCDARLDEWAWEQRKMQRKLVEREA